MVALLALPLFDGATEKRGTGAAPAPRTLPRVEAVYRQGKLLHETPLGPTEEVLGLNLTRGCVHQCPFCFVHSSSRYSGDVVELAQNAAERLSLELRAGPRPRAVFLSPACDPFPPLNEVQQAAAEIIGVLARHDVGAWVMTRGEIRPQALAVLAEHRDRVRVTVPLTTLDRALQRRLEPFTASPRLRIQQIRRLQELGIPVQVSLDPLGPDVTDTRENLEPVLEALAELGIRQVSVGYLSLSDRAMQKLAAALEGTGQDELILEAYRGGPVLTQAGLPPARYLSKHRRQRGYAMVMALAARLGIQVTVNALSNPDFGLRRPDPEVRNRPTLLSQFLAAGRHST